MGRDGKMGGGGGTGPQRKKRIMVTDPKLGDKV